MSALPFAAPALPLDEAGKYVAGAYIVFIALILIDIAVPRDIESSCAELPSARSSRRWPVKTRPALAGPPAR